MAQDITLLGASYSDVPAVDLPKTGGGTARFVDISSDTVEASKLVEGYVAHDSQGNEIVGTLVTLYIEPYEYDYIPGYVATGKWTYENSTNNRTDAYNVRANHRYFLGLGETVGTRFRATILDTNPVGTNLTITGTGVAEYRNPAAFASVTFTSAIDGFLMVTKDNTGVSGLKSYLVDVTTI